MTISHNQCDSSSRRYTSRCYVQFKISKLRFYSCTNFDILQDVCAVTFFTYEFRYTPRCLCSHVFQVTIFTKIRNTKKNYSRFTIYVIRYTNLKMYELWITTSYELRISTTIFIQLWECFGSHSKR